MFAFEDWISEKRKGQNQRKGRSHVRPLRV